MTPTTLREPSWDEARAAAFGVGKVRTTEIIALSLAHNRILASAAYAKVPLPTYTTSAMDGYVVSGVGPWKLNGEIKAGIPHPVPLESGYALKIATGAVIPEGALAVIRWENATCIDDIVFAEAIKGKDFRPAGIEALEGDLLVEVGERLSPSKIGLLAASGYDSVEVFTIPEVTLILFGDEIKREGLPASGLVRDSLGPQIPGWLARMGCAVTRVDYVADTLSETVEAIKNATRNSQIILTTGGTAAGPRDFLHDAIAELGGFLLVDEVAVRPGHPQLLALVKDVPLIGLPGNPQSAVVALMTLAMPLIDASFGRALAELPIISTQEELEIAPNFTKLAIGNLLNGAFIASDYSGSAMLRGLASSSGFAVATNPPTPLRWLELPS